MKRFLSMLIILVALTGCGTTTSPSSGAAAPAATPVVSQTAAPTADSAASTAAADVSTPAPPGDTSEIVTSKITSWKNSIGSSWVMVAAEVKNDSSGPLFLSNGSIDLEDSSGGLVKTMSMVSAYPQVILPGESAFYFTSDTDSSISDTTDYSAILHYDAKPATVPATRYPVSELQAQSSNLDSLKIIGRVENNTSDEAKLVYAAALVRDKDGAPLCVLFTIINSIKAGDKIGFEASALTLPDTVTPDSIGNYDVYAYPMQFQF